MVESKELESGAGKIKEPIKMEDYVVKNPELALRNVFLSGFPLFRTGKEPQITISSSDPDNLRIFKVSLNFITGNVILDDGVAAQKGVNCIHVPGSLNLHSLNSSCIELMIT